MKQLIALALLFCTYTATAQVDQPTTLPSPTPSCILNTPEEAWVGIGLTAEEVEQVQGIQTVCETECTSLEETGQYNLEKNAAVLQLYHDKVRAVLGEERYSAWQNWCAKRTGRS